MLEKITKDKQILLERLMQVYYHDISADFPLDINNETMLYEIDDLSKYFENKNNIGYFIKYEDKIAGFVLVDLYEDKNVIDQIFVLNNYKKHSLAKLAVFKIFDMYKGYWEIKAVPCSKRAEMFWTKVISEYTDNNYEENRIGKYSRLILNFNNTVSNTCHK